MADVLLTTGDDFEHPLFVEDDDLPIGIPLSATVEAALIDVDDIVLIAATAVSSATAGSDWPGGKIVVKFTNAQTDAIPNPPMLARLAVKITLTTGRETTYFSDYFQILAGAIA